ncbi:hypothetical protein NLK61_28475 [Pseudomonas fuscovaginae UPB0736]|uniref:hypothetical protein n=1 Tax=Pseudomonas asplenii TaxID=53407 RepID=UPI00211EC88E|nr:hypothetical protein [Pseudomonas fuscovaginae]UUQ65073.1 hypothetical protein NLK61_28475 [Pseudomonas fuscovaginae UPB0736]
MKWASRVELRFVALWAPSTSTQAICADLNALLGAAQLGLLDGHNLYPCCRNMA